MKILPYSSDLAFLQTSHFSREIDGDEKRSDNVESLGGGGMATIGSGAEHEALQPPTIAGG